MTPGSMEYVIMRNIKVRTHAMAVANWYHQGRVRILAGQHHCQSDIPRDLCVCMHSMMSF